MTGASTFTTLFVILIDGQLVGQAETDDINIGTKADIGFAGGLSYPLIKCAGTETRCPVSFQSSKARFDEIALFNSALDATAISRHYAAARLLLP